MDVPSPAAPATAEFEEGLLHVADGHRIYWRAQGDVSMPALCILHGGPGGSHMPRSLQLIDPTQWRVVMFDQRGCGRSTPSADTAHNTTAHLVDDMEALRESLGIDRWALFGGSWGTRLALSYAARHPDRCLGFLMRAVFLARREDITWFLWDVRRLFPDHHAAFCAVIERLAGRAPRDPDDFLDLTAPVLQPDHPGRFELAQAWDRFETAISTVGSQPPPATPAANAPAAAASRSTTLAVLEHHYMRNVLPLEAPILDQVERFAHLPCEIVHGRYDAVCPIEQAWLLARCWPAAVLTVANVSGHWGFAPEMADLLRQASTKLNARIQGQT